MGLPVVEIERNIRLFFHQYARVEDLGLLLLRDQRQGTVEYRIGFVATVNEVHVLVEHQVIGRAHQAEGLGQVAAGVDSHRHAQAVFPDGGVDAVDVVVDADIDGDDLDFVAVGLLYLFKMRHLLAAGRHPGVAQNFR